MAVRELFEKGRLQTPICTCLLQARICCKQLIVQLSQNRQRQQQTTALLPSQVL